MATKRQADGKRGVGLGLEVAQQAFRLVEGPTRRQRGTLSETKQRCKWRCRIAVAAAAERASRSRSLSVCVNWPSVLGVLAATGSWRVCCLAPCLPGWLLAWWPCCRLGLYKLKLMMHSQQATGDTLGYLPAGGCKKGGEGAVVVT